MDPKHPSSIEPGKRPRLTPNPAMIFKDNKPFLILGTPGLDVQIQAMTQLFMNITEFGMNPQEAIEAPRFASYSFPLTNIMNNYEPGVLRCEKNIKENVIDNLSKLGHKIKLWDQKSYLAGGTLCNSNK